MNGFFFLSKVSCVNLNRIRSFLFITNWNASFEIQEKIHMGKIFSLYYVKLAPKRRRKKKQKEKVLLLINPRIYVRKNSQTNIPQTFRWWKIFFCFSLYKYRLMLKQITCIWVNKYCCSSIYAYALNAENVFRAFARAKDYLYTFCFYVSVSVSVVGISSCLVAYTFKYRNKWAMKRTQKHQHKIYIYLYMYSIYVYVIYKYDDFHTNFWSVHLVRRP